MLTVSPTQDQTFDAIQAFLLQVLPQTTQVASLITNSSGMNPTENVTMEVFVYDANRVPEPQVLDYIIMTPLRRDRIFTNVDLQGDVKFTASIAGTLMNVTSVDRGVLSLGSTIFGVGVSDNVYISSLGTGTGGVGTYNLNTSQNLSSRVISAGRKSMLQSTQLTVQLDIHGPQSADIAQILSTVLRDEYSYDAFQILNSNVTPLHADDPIQMPFVNDQQQFEFRWIITALFEVDASVLVPQQYADDVDLGIISVDERYPP